MSSLQGYLSQLGISLTDILLDPGIFIELYSDPEKAKILSKVQDILPEFSARELNDLLSVKLEIDDRVPNADKIMKIMFSLPFSATGKVRRGFFRTSLNQFNSRTYLLNRAFVLLQLFKLDLKPEELAILESVFKKVLGTNDMKALLAFFTGQFDMMSEGECLSYTDC